MSEMILSRLERDLKPVDIIQAKKRALERLRNHSFGIATAGDVLPSDVETLEIGERKIFWWKSGAVLIDQIPNENKPRKPLLGWEFIDAKPTQQDFYSLNTYITPRLQELGIPLLPGITFNPAKKNDKAMAESFNTLMCGTLEVFLKDPGPSFIENHHFIQTIPYDTTVIMQMYRLDPFQSASERGRAPQIASSSFLREFMLAMRQLRTAGYTTILGEPTDQRRERVYQAMGMSVIRDQNNKKFTFLDLLSWNRLKRYPMKD